MAECLKPASISAAGFFLFARVVYVSMMIDLSSTSRTNFVKASCRGTSRGL